MWDLFLHPFEDLIVSTMLWVPSFRILKSDQSCWETLKFSWWTGIEPVKCQILSGCESGLPPGCLFLSALWGISKSLYFYPHRPVAFSDFCAIFILTWLRDLVGISGVLELCKPFMHHGASRWQLFQTCLSTHDDAATAWLIQCAYSILYLFGSWAVMVTLVTRENGLVCIRIPRSGRRQLYPALCHLQHI